MTWTYEPSDLATERKDEVRFLVGDTDETDMMVQDEEINLVLGQYPALPDRPAWLAAAHVCDAIAARFARQVQRSVGSLSQSAQQQYEHYKDLSASLRLMYATNGQTNIQLPGMANVSVAGPVLGGGGRTYLGPTRYEDPEDYDGGGR